jgi:anti-sigma B factor antagonist
MQLIHEIMAGVLVVKPLEKRLDASIAADFKGQMGAFLNEGHELIVLDLSEVDFMDSSGLGAIVSSLKMLGGKGDLAIAGASPKVVSLFKLTRMDRVFLIFANKEDAVARLLS